jgi:hypothetical protein
MRFVLVHSPSSVHPRGAVRLRLTPSIRDGFAS